jgi:endo-1,4-beta-xylanase
MVSFLTLLLISVSTITGVSSAPQRRDLSVRQTLTSPSSGLPVSSINNGYYYYYWSENNAQEEVTLGSAGSYSVTWSGDALPYFVGKGWNPGSVQ